MGDVAALPSFSKKAIRCCCALVSSFVSRELPFSSRRVVILVQALRTRHLAVDFRLRALLRPLVVWLQAEEADGRLLLGLVRGELGLGHRLTNLLPVLRNLL